MNRSVDSVFYSVRYWGFLALKLTAAFFASATTLWFLNLFWLPYTGFWKFVDWARFSYDLFYTTLTGVAFLFSIGLFYLAIREQRYRCRTCLRKLIMPVETGSWGYMLQLGRPQMEYICPYGHGKLNVDEVQISGNVPAAWTEQGDIWDELFASAESDDEFRR